MFDDELLAIYFYKHVHDIDLFGIYSIWKSHDDSVIKVSSANYYLNMADFNKKIDSHWKSWLSQVTPRWVEEILEDWFEEEKKSTRVASTMSSVIVNFRDKCTYYFQHNKENHTEMIRLLRSLQDQIYNFPYSINKDYLEKKLRVILTYKRTHIYQKSRLDRYEIIRNEFLPLLSKTDVFIKKEMAASFET